MPRPVIGVTCYVEPASWGAWRGVSVALLPQRYVDHVHRAGGRAVLVPPLSSTGALNDTADEAATLLDRLDGLVVAGGADVEPARYSAEPHPTVQPSRPDREASELALVTAALAADVPLLGICRGMQVMAVQDGGTLEQHLPDRIGHERHSPGPGRYGVHVVNVLPGTRLADILGDSVDVSTYHHQGVTRHPSYTASAYADDGVLEAMERIDRRFCLAVQWHPEEGDDNRLFEALVHVAQSIG
ncbi:gamma-glutamyl-gamma-aminobutyrate hydrolase family protein [Cumulibacter manganitolerans]|uniref:gamma-glutamyl-gamma-aminobutyrate hydrolase family protein n=1 Tax=Cumulibacter manganitolerans TaxID=1884992 RepID=UPI001297B474|nr:gamma-glutamyl-gamma-aminobutyrate hydrolase family protein [Cumulibacter manganitolerans]